MTQKTFSKTLVPSSANAQTPLVVPAVTGAMTANFNSAPIAISKYNTVSIQASWTGTPTGTLQLQISNDPTLFPAGGPQVWTNYSGTSAPVSGTPDSFVWNLNCPALWVRVAYTFTSGTGQLTVYTHGKAPN